MSAPQTLSQTYIERHPADAARVIEQLPVETALAFLTSLSELQVQRVFRHLVPSSSSPLFRQLDDRTATACLRNMEPELAAQLIRGLDEERAQALMAQLPRQVAQGIRHYLNYSEQVIGAIMSSRFLVLPAAITASDAIRRVERSAVPIGGEIYVVDERGHLSGVIETAQLFQHKRQAVVQNLMHPHAPFVSDGVKISAALNHPGWSHYRSLPVVGKNGMVLGLIGYSQLHQYQAPARREQAPQSLLELFFSIFSLYWISLSGLVDTLLGVPSNRR